MTVVLSIELLEQIQADAEEHYPEEGAGLILGTLQHEARRVSRLLLMSNTFEAGARSHRYQIEPEEMLKAEMQAESDGLDVLGVFHSHPDHPAEPSEFDRQNALPWYSYLITRVEAGSAVETRAWRLVEDHTQFIEEEIVGVDTRLEEKQS